MTPKKRKSVLRQTYRWVTPPGSAPITPIEADAIGRAILNDAAKAAESMYEAAENEPDKDRARELIIRADNLSELTARVRQGDA